MLAMWPMKTAKRAREPSASRTATAIEIEGTAMPPPPMLPRRASRARQ